MSIWLDSIYEIAGLVIFLAGFLWLAQKKFENRIYLTVFLLPLYLFKIKIFFIPMNVLEIMIGLLFLLWLANKRYRAVEFFEIRKFSLPALLILNGAILSTLLSQNLEVSAGILKSWFVVPLIFALMVVAEIKNEAQIKKIFCWLAISGGLIGVVGLIYFLSGEITFDRRLAAFFLSPNHLAMALAPGFFTALAMIGLAEKKEKPLWLAALAVDAAALFLTFSYAAWIALLAAIVFWLFGRAKNKKRMLAVCGLLFLLLVGILFVSQSKSEKLDNFLHSPRSSWQSRLMIWRAAWAIGKDHFVFGIGPGIFQEYYLKYQSRFSVPYLEWSSPQPHNLFLAFWLQTGLIGLIGFLWLIIVFFIYITRGWTAFSCCGSRPALGEGLGSNSPRGENAIHARGQLLLILAALMIYILLHGLIDTTYFKNDLAVVFWLVLALAVSLGAVKKMQTG